MGASRGQGPTSELMRSGMAPRPEDERLRYLTRATRDGVYDWDISTGVIWCGETFRDLFARPDTTEIDRSWWERHLHRDDRERVAASLDRAFQERLAVWSEQYRFQRSDHGYATVIDRSSILYDDAGRAVRMIGALTDITERERVEGAMRTSEARYRALVEALCDDVLTLGPWNGSGASDEIMGWWQRLTGQTPEDQARVGSWLDVIHPEDRDRVGEAWARSAESGMPYHIEYRVRSRTGDYRHILVRGVPVRGTDGALREYAGMLTDITDLKRLEEQLRQAQKMEAVGRLAGGVAHDFNNLLTVISGYSELIMERLPDDEKVVRAIAEIRNAGARGMGITGQLLAFGRKAVIQPVTADLNAAVAEAEAMLRRLIGEHIELTATYDPALWRVRADRVQIDQVLLNLAVNARDAMPQGGQLALTTRNVTVGAQGVDAIPGLRPGDYVRLSVTDTGCGMDEGTKVRVFEPFFTTKDAGRGTGMGLAVVYGIVQQSGGHISVTSQPNKGSTFDIYLPRCLDEVRDEEREQAAASVPTGRETVILVEDEESVRGLAREILTRHGYTVLEAKDGPDALKLCQRHTGPIDLLVTDVVMPRMSGLRLADRLRALRPQIKTLFISGYLDDVLGEFGALAGDVTLLQKPFAASALARKVREVLDRS